MLDRTAVMGGSNENASVLFSLFFTKGFSVFQNRERNPGSRVIGIFSLEQKA
jgi:hypothetical protein